MTTGTCLSRSVPDLPRIIRLVPWMTGTSPNPPHFTCTAIITPNTAPPRIDDVHETMK